MLDLPALLLRWAPGAFWAITGLPETRLPSFLKFRGRRLVFGKFAGRLRPDPPLEQLQDLIRPGQFVFEDDDDIVDFDLARWFDGPAGDADVSTAAGFGGEAAGFENTHRPQPLVQPHRRGLSHERETTTPSPRNSILNPQKFVLSLLRQTWLAGGR